ncbi:hypothetical protein GCM10018966_065420 [Streptomyces yanii]
MAVRRQLIAREPSVHWAVPEDESRYADWAVGTFDSAPANGRWPEGGSSTKYTARVGPKEFHGRTTVRRLDAPRTPELESHAGPLSTARIAFDIRPWGDKTLVILDDPPLRGLGGGLRNTVLDAFAQIRNRGMLRRLAGSRRRDAPGHGVSCPCGSGLSHRTRRPCAVNGLLARRHACCTFSEAVEANGKALPAQNALASLLAEDKKESAAEFCAGSHSYGPSGGRRTGRPGVRVQRVVPCQPRRKRRLPKRGGSDSEARTANTSSCVLRARCPVATSSPLQDLTCRRLESDMGLITGLLTLPVAPVRGVIWMAELSVAAEHQVHDPGVLRASWLD